MGFKDAVRRHIQGKKHDLKSLPGYWFKPRKYNLEGGEIIQNFSEELRKVLKDSKVWGYIKKLQDKGIKDPTVDDIYANFSAEEIQEYFDAFGDLGKRGTAELHRNVLLYGTGENNFGDGDENLSGVSEEIVNILCESQDAVNEMVPIIIGHNAPLAKRTSKKSET
jgi:hypothetical protein